uniref:CSON004507 protein n=1 Tax=Culicoides sonorensis TaxID=179676 RepID=A0A336LTX9_CULSO
MNQIRPLTTELNQIALRDLNESSERIQNDVETIRNWMHQIGYIRGREDAQFIIAFLRGCKFSLERTKEKIDLFYTGRFIVPEFYNGKRYQDERIIELLKLGLSIPLPQTKFSDSPRVVLIRSCSFDHTKVHIREIMRMACMMSEIMLIEDDNFIVAGLINVIDMVGASKSLGYVGQFTPTLIKHIAYVTQDAMPVRLKQMHFLNPPPTFDSVFQFFKTLFNKKNSERAEDTKLVLECHGTNMDGLFRFIPQKLFPNEYGGEAGTIDELMSVWEEKFKKYRGYFEEDENYGTIEKLRPNPLKNNSNLYGVDGSFRQLNVD